MPCFRNWIKQIMTTVSIFEYKANNFYLTKRVSMIGLNKQRQLLVLVTVRSNNCFLTKTCFENRVKVSKTDASIDKHWIK